MRRTTAQPTDAGAGLYTRMSASPDNSAHRRTRVRQSGLGPDLKRSRARKTKKQNKKHARPFRFEMHTYRIAFRTDRTVLFVPRSGERRCSDPRCGALLNVAAAANRVHTGLMWVIACTHWYSVVHHAPCACATIVAIGSQRRALARRASLMHRPFGARCCYRSSGMSAIVCPHIAHGRCALRNRVCGCVCVCGPILVVIACRAH